MFGVSRTELFALYVKLESSKETSRDEVSSMVAFNRALFPKWFGYVDG